ncbi:MAG: glycoside hydrolase family 1 protein [Bdellovibrionales bacterium]|nr:glycoside hydrolase family 1 protein [Bdellovibrionales bacterium]
MFAPVLGAVLASSGGVVHAETEVLNFPQGFKWCVATAAHQIEGGNVNSDWWAFEHQPGTIKNGDVSGDACDHWNRVLEDSLLMKTIGVSMYRFSVEWAKIEPREGEWDKSALFHYLAEVETLRALGIEPIVTLQHFTLPQWMRLRGGWEWDGSPAAFERFSRKVYETIGHRVRDFVTINEPMVPVVGGYLAGLIPPQKANDLTAGVLAIKGMLRSHARAYAALHDLASAASRPVRVGFAHHLRVFDPLRPLNPVDRVAASIFDNAFNWGFYDAVETGRLKLWIPTMMNVDVVIPGLAGTQDFIGLNYYTRDMVKFSLGGTSGLPMELVANPDMMKNDLGWEIYPWGFYRILKKIKARTPNKPIVITENGTADHDDSFRQRYLSDHLKALHKAMAEGVAVEGYCHWSLMDNFEWVEGFEPRFGLFEMNYSTMRRIPRPSAYLFADIASRNRVERDASVPWGSWRK